MKKFTLKQLILFGGIAIFTVLIVSVTGAAPTMGGDYSVSRLSVGTGGVEGNGPSYHVYTSSDGRYAAFESYSQNWVYDGPPSEINYADMFLRDLQTGSTIKISNGMQGEPGADKSVFPSMSFDGRYVVYLSLADNLVPDDTNGQNPWEDDGLDLFLYDRLFGSTVRVSLNYAGEQINGESIGTITADGRLIVFASNGTNVMPTSSPEGVTYLYVRDWQTGAIERITQTIDGAYPDGIIHQIGADYDGDYIIYSSDLDNLVPNDFNNAQDVFLYNRQTGETMLVSKTPAGFSANGASARPQLSPGGEYLVFTSFASNLGPVDTNGLEDVYLYEIATGNMRRISLTSTGLEADGGNREPSICEGGRYISWTSEATNLVPGDTNGFRDIYFYDTVLDQIRLVTKDPNGLPANDEAHRSWLSPDCRYMFFASDASNVISNDYNGVRDIFVGRLIWPFNLSTSTQTVPAFADPGETLTYRIQVRNSGLETDTASFASPIPENTTFISGSGTNGAIYNSSLDQVEWSGTVMGESEEEMTFSVLVSPVLTETVFLTLETQVTGDDIGYTLEDATVVNGYYSMLPVVSRD